MKKIFTLITVAMIITVSALAQTQTVVLCNPNKAKENVLEGAQLGAPDGWKIKCMKEEKNLESGNDFTINGVAYKGIKFSNGAQNTVTLPTGYVATKVTFYSTVNKDAATERPAYWKEVNGITYSEADAEIMKSFKDYENPDINIYELGKVAGFTFTNAGEQPFAVLVVEYEEGTANDIADITAENNETYIPAYNLAGQKVDTSYKGIVIKNGKKFVNK